MRLVRFDWLADWRFKIARNFQTCLRWLEGYALAAKFRWNCSARYRRRTDILCRGEPLYCRTCNALGNSMDCVKNSTLISSYTWSTHHFIRGPPIFASISFFESSHFLCPASGEKGRADSLHVVPSCRTIYRTVSKWYNGWNDVLALWGAVFALYRRDSGDASHIIHTIRRLYQWKRYRCLMSGLRTLVHVGF